jgi:hypothetical protein
MHASFQHLLARKIKVEATGKSSVLGNGYQKLQ